MREPPWEELEHTADWALHVWGQDLRALFENAARGMVQLVGGEADPAETPIRHTIELEAPDPETLLVDWLSELLYLIEDRGIVFEDIAVRSLEGLRLTAEVAGRPGGRFTKHIKAATYHNLSIHCEAGRCETTIVFDV